MKVYSSNPKVSECRFHVDGRDIYVVRDVYETKNRKRKFSHCEYAAPSGHGVEWKKTYEGASFDDIEPRLRTH